MTCASRLFDYDKGVFEGNKTSVNVARLEGAVLHGKQIAGLSKVCGTILRLIARRGVWQVFVYRVRDMTGGDICSAHIASYCHHGRTRVFFRGDPPFLVRFLFKGVRFFIWES